MCKMASESESVVVSDSSDVAVVKFTKQSGVKLILKAKWLQDLVKHIQKPDIREEDMLTVNAIWNAMTKCKQHWQVCKARLSAFEWWEKRGKASHPMNCDDSAIYASQPSSYELYWTAGIYPAILEGRVSSETQTETS